MSSKARTKNQFFKYLQPFLINSGTIKKAYYWGLWSPKKDKAILDSYIALLLEKCKGFPDFEIGNNGLPEGINNFSVWNDLHFIIEIIYVNNFFDKDFVKVLFDSIESKMFKWILRPKEFDYSSFKINWILSFRDKNITKVLKTIDPLKSSISIGLNEHYNEHIAKVYFEHLAK